MREGEEAESLYGSLYDVSKNFLTSNGLLPCFDTDEIDFNTTQGDNCFRAHEAAIYEFISGKQAELVYANFTNTVYDRPYAIFIDRKWQTVVISIRGTLSLEDCLADANHEPVNTTKLA